MIDEGQSTTGDETVTDNVTDNSTKEEGQSLFTGDGEVKDEAAPEGDNTETPNEGDDENPDQWKQAYEELEERHKNLLDIHRGRVKEMDPDALREAAVAAGLKLREAPESYEGIADVMSEAGIYPLPQDEENAAAWNEFEGQLREAGYDMDDVKFWVGLGGNWVKKQVANIGPDTDKDAEMEKLQQEWGDDTGNLRKSVAQWASNNLPSDVYTKPLWATAEGMKLLARLSKEAKGTQPIVSDKQTTSFDALELDKQINEIVASDEYKDPLNPHHKAALAKAEALVRRQLSARKD